MIRTLHLEAWAGSWVALDREDRIVASAPTQKDLMATLDAEGIQDVEILRAPHPNEAIPCTGLAGAWLYSYTDFGDGPDQSPPPVLRAAVPAVRTGADRR